MVAAQDAPPEPVDAETAPAEPAAPATAPGAEPVDPRAEAQAKVERARKLAKLQRFDEAMALAEDAFLVLDDPELIRLLGEWALAKGDAKRAVGFLETYLKEPSVGERAKARPRELLAQARTQAGEADPDVKADGGDDDDTYGLTGWRSAEAKHGVQGQVYLFATGRYAHDEGASFDTVRGGSGADASVRVDGSWVHGGLGVGFEAGAYVIDDVSLGLGVGNDWMSWEMPTASAAFGTTLYSGLRPEVTVNGRWFAGWGLVLGANAGIDWVVLTEGAASATACAAGQECTSVTIEDGVQGWRWFAGGLLGYRAELTNTMHFGIDTNIRWVPGFQASQPIVRDAPSMTDGSVLVLLQLGLNWNL